MINHNNWLQNIKAIIIDELEISNPDAQGIM